MIETLTLNTRKSDSPACKARISPLRRGERNNVTLTVAVRSDRRIYDLTGMTAHLVWQAADGKIVGPVPMEVVDPAAGTVRCTLPDACYAAVGMARAYIELRKGAELVDTTNEMIIKVLDCIDADAGQAEEYKPLIAEVRAATDAAVKAAKRAESGEDERVKAEAGRVSAERGRASAETARADAEQARNRAESARASSEALRVSAETSRADAESLREKAFAKSMREVDAATKTANAANSAATKAVADAQAAIAEVKATEAKLYPAAENILKGTAKDTFVHVDDAFAGAALREITVEGACRQDGTPSPDNPVPIQVIENPVVRVTGRNLLNPEQVAVGATNIYSASDGMLTVKCRDERAWTGIDPSIALPAGTYCASGDYLEIRDELSNTVINGSGPFTLARDSRLKVKVGTTAQAYPYTSKAQIERGSTSSDYAPYTSQSLTFTLPAEHPYLAKLPYGMADEIVADADGNVELVARVGVDKDVRTLSSFAQGEYYALKTKIPPYSSYDAFFSEHGSKIALCSSLPYSGDSASGYGVYRSWNGVIVRDTSGRTKEEIQAEVDKNAPLTVVALIPETRYPLGKIELPKAQDSVVNVWTDAEITPSTGIEYARDVNIVVANLESAIASIS